MVWALQITPRTHLVSFFRQLTGEEPVSVQTCMQVEKFACKCSTPTMK